jgi:hypothetical protein
MISPQMQLMRLNRSMRRKDGVTDIETIVRGQFDRPSLISMHPLWPTQLHDAASLIHRSWLCC